MTNLAFAAGLAYALWKIAHYRARRKMRGLFGPWPIGSVAPGAFDARLATEALGPSMASEIRFVPSLGVAASVSDLETWILCNLARSARRVFEFGTASGKTAYLLAANAPPDAEIVTLTLAPDQAGSYRAGDGDDRGAREAALNESTFRERFYYSGRAEAAKIVQLFGDSKSFDETPYAGTCDLVFIDGAHARSYVESDTRKAIRMAKPGGAILWHDYRGPRAPIDVFRYLNELGRELPGMVHLAGTALVAWRKPAGGEQSSAGATVASETLLAAK